MESNKKQRGRPATGTTPLRQVRIKRWDDIPAKNKSKWINDIIDRALKRQKISPPSSSARNTSAD